MAQFIVMPIREECYEAPSTKSEIFMELISTQWLFVQTIVMSEGMIDPLEDLLWTHQGIGN